MSEYQNPEEGASLTGKDKPKLVTSVLYGAVFSAAFTAVALPFLFRKEGLPLEMFWLLALPGYTIFKWLMALVVDNYGSKARQTKILDHSVYCDWRPVICFARSLPSLLNLSSHYSWDTHFQVLCHGCPGYCCGCLRRRDND